MIWIAHIFLANSSLKQQQSIKCNSGQLYIISQQWLFYFLPSSQPRYTGDTMDGNITSSRKGYCQMGQSWYGLYRRHQQWKSSGDIFMKCKVMKKKYLCMVQKAQQMMDSDSDFWEFSVYASLSLSHTHWNKNCSIQVQRKGPGCKSRQSSPQDSRNNRWPLLWRPPPPHPSFLTLHIPPSVLSPDPPLLLTVASNKLSPLILIFPSNQTQVLLFPLLMPCHSVLWFYSPTSSLYLPQCPSHSHLFYLSFSLVLH